MQARKPMAAGSLLSHSVRQLNTSTLQRAIATAVSVVEGDSCNPGDIARQLDVDPSCSPCARSISSQTRREQTQFEDQVVPRAWLLHGSNLAHVVSSENDNGKVVVDDCPFEVLDGRLTRLESIWPELNRAEIAEFPLKKKANLPCELQALR